MTDREAIRRLAGLVERLAYANDIELLSKDAREFRRDYERFSAEPTAPTVTTADAERIIQAFSTVVGPHTRGGSPIRWPEFLREVADALEDR